MSLKTPPPGWVGMTGYKMSRFSRQFMKFPALLKFWPLKLPPWDSPGVGWVKFCWVQMIPGSIRICMPNLVAIWRSCRKKRGGTDRRTHTQRDTAALCIRLSVLWRERYLFQHLRKRSCTTTQGCFPRDGTGRTCWDQTRRMGRTSTRWVAVRTRFQFVLIVLPLKTPGLTKLCGFDMEGGGGGTARTRF